MKKPAEKFGSFKKKCCTFADDKMATATANKKFRMYPFEMRRGSHWGLLIIMSNIILSAQSSSNEIKAYFNSVLTLTKSGEKFPVDLDDVWPLCYVQKVKAVQFLTDSGQFYEGEDYILLSQKVKQTENVCDGVFSQKVKKPLKNDGVFSQKVKKPINGRPTNKYMLSVPCMEYLIARKVRAVFEVYRRVFHEFLNTKRMSKAEMRNRDSLIESAKSYGSDCEFLVKLFAGNS